MRKFFARRGKKPSPDQSNPETPEEGALPPDAFSIPDDIPASEPLSEDFSADIDDATEEGEQQGARSAGINTKAAFMKGVVPGLVVLAVTIAGVFFQESKAIKQHQIYQDSLGAVVKVPAGRVDPRNEGKLVLVTGRVTTDDVLRDRQLGVSANAIRMKRRTKMYQWIEKEQPAVGGRDVTYAVTKDWSEEYWPPLKFSRLAHDYINPKMHFQSKDYHAQDVRVGGFALSQDITDRIPGDTQLELTEENRNVFRARPQWLKRIKVYEGGFYIGRGTPQNTLLGDTLAFYYVLEPGAVITLLGKQEGETVVPYMSQHSGTLFFAEPGNKTAEQLIGPRATGLEPITWAQRVAALVLVFVAGWLCTRVWLSVPVVATCLTHKPAIAALLWTVAFGPLILALPWMAEIPAVSNVVWLTVAAFLIPLGRYLISQKDKLAEIKLNMPKKKAPEATAEDLPPEDGSPTLSGAAPEADTVAPEQGAPEAAADPQGAAPDAGEEDDEDDLEHEFEKAPKWVMMKARARRFIRHAIRDTKPKIEEVKERISAKLGRTKVVEAEIMPGPEAPPEDMAGQGDDLKDAVIVEAEPITPQASPQEQAAPPPQGEPAAAEDEYRETVHVDVEQVKEEGDTGMESSFYEETDPVEQPSAAAAPVPEQQEAPQAPPAPPSPEQEASVPPEMPEAPAPEAAPIITPPPPPAEDSMGAQEAPQEEVTPEVLQEPSEAPETQETPAAPAEEMPQEGGAGVVQSFGQPVPQAPEAAPPDEPAPAEAAPEPDPSSEAVAFGDMKPQEPTEEPAQEAPQAEKPVPLAEDEEEIEEVDPTVFQPGQPSAAPEEWEESTEEPTEGGDTAPPASEEAPPAAPESPAEGAPEAPPEQPGAASAAPAEEEHDPTVFVPKKPNVELHPDVLKEKEDAEQEEKPPVLAPETPPEETPSDVPPSEPPQEEQPEDSASGADAPPEKKPE